MLTSAISLNGRLMASRADLSRYFETYRSACTTHPEIVEFVRYLEEMFNEWSGCLEAPDQLVELPSVDRLYLVGKVKNRLKMLVKAVDRVLKPQAAREIEEENHNARVQPTNDGMIAALERYVVLQRDRLGSG